jgi:hypothetical protein
MTRFTMPTRERMKQPPKPAPKKKAFPAVREAKAGPSRSKPRRGR